MKITPIRRLGLLTAVSGLGLAAMAGTASAGTYTAYGHTYTTRNINGVDVAVDSDGTILWNSVADPESHPEEDVPVDPGEVPDPGLAMPPA